MIAILKTACLMGASSFLKPAHVVAQPMLAPVVWGNNDRGGDTTLSNNEDITGVVKVSCGGYACAGLKTDGSVIAWGDWLYGGKTTRNNNEVITGAVKVTCGGYACAALKADGSVIAWGGNGADTRYTDVTGITQIVCGGNACAGLKIDGTIVAWGRSDAGGDVQGKDVTGMAQLVCGKYVCAGLKTNGSVIAWGMSGYGADTQGKDLTDMVQISCGDSACAGVKSDGSVIAWGISGYGGDTQGKDVTGIAKVVCGHRACVGLKTNGVAIVWGESASGEDTQGKDLSGIAQIVSGNNSFAGLKTDGSVVSWGQTCCGGDTQGKDVTGIVKVVCGLYACTGLKINGSVVTWGSSGNGGDTQGKDVTGANQITCGYNVCVAWYDPDTAGGGGDPHFIGFGGVYFTWQGHCDLVMVKSKLNIETNTHYEVHIRTTRIRKWSKIDTIAIKVGQDVGEISSVNGKFILNGHEVNKVQQQSLTVVKSNLKGNIILYSVTIDGDKKLEIKVNTLSQMINTSLSGNYSQNTEGILGSSHQPGLLSRNGDYMPGTDVNAFAETWQVRDTDPHLFTTNRAPQYPSKCLYDTKKTASSHHTRHLKQLHTVQMLDAKAACANHRPGPLQNFCVDDVIMTGDLDSAKDEFYE